ncbi:Hypothetical protein NocV09_03300480 [Nannochloropsis oceanica]
MLQVCDKAENDCWRALQKFFPAQATRLARLDRFERDLQYKLLRKRRLSTQHMGGPDVAPATQTLRIYVHHRFVRLMISPSSSLSSKESVIGSRSRGGDGSGNDGRGGRDGGGGKGGPALVLRIEGGVLQAAGSAGAVGSDARQFSPHYYFTEFFDRVTVLGLQQEIAPRRGGEAVAGEGGEEGNEVEWIRPPSAHAQETDGLEFSQPLQDQAAHGVACKVRILLDRRQYLEQQYQGRRRLSPELSKVLRLRKEERQETVEAALLGLIATRQLFLHSEPGWIQCDDDLWRLFGRGLEEERTEEERGGGGGGGGKGGGGGGEEDDGEGRSGKLHVSTLASRLEEHLSPLEPLVIDYKIPPCQDLDDDKEGERKEGGEGSRWRERTRIFDVQVETGPGRDDLQARLNALVEESQLLPPPPSAPQQQRQQQRLQQRLQQPPRRVKARSRRKKGRKRRRRQAKKEVQEQIPVKKEDENPEEGEEEEGQEEEDEEEEEEEEAGEEAIRRLDKKIAYVGGLLMERVRTLVRLKELAKNPGQVLVQMEEEEAVAAMLGEDTLRSVVGVLKRTGSGGGEAEDSEGSGSPSSLWLKYLDQYLQQPQQQHPAAIR